MKQPILIMLVALGGLGLSSPAFAQGNTPAEQKAAAAPTGAPRPDDGVITEQEEILDAKDDAEDASSEETDKNWGVSAGISTIVGQGTFIGVSRDTPYEGDLVNADNSFDRVAQSYSVGASYTLSDFTLSVGAAWVKPLTVGGSQNIPYAVRFQDVSTSLGWAGYQFETTGISVGASANVSFPTSVYSQSTSQYVSTGLSVSASKRFFNRLSLTLFAGGGKVFHEYTSPIADLDDAGQGNVLFRAGGSEELRNSIVAIGTRNVEYSMNAGGSLGARLVDKLSLGVSYSFGEFFSYDTSTSALDAMSNPNATAGRQTSQFVGTSISLSYPFLTYFNAAIGTQTGVAPKTEDNRSFRFPFWNFEGAAANRSSLFASLSARY